MLGLLLSLSLHLRRSLFIYYQRNNYPLVIGHNFYGAQSIEIPKDNWRYGNLVVAFQVISTQVSSMRCLSCVYFLNSDWKIFTFIACLGTYLALRMLFIEKILLAFDVLVGQMYSCQSGHLIGS